MHNVVSRLGHILRPGYEPCWPSPFPPEHTLVINSFKRLIAALAFVLPVVALVASPVMATTQNHAKSHHSVHKASSHKAHGKNAPATG
jgi:hypothetical protein